MRGINKIPRICAIILPETNLRTFEKKAVMDYYTNNKHNYLRCCLINLLIVCWVNRPDPQEKYTGKEILDQDTDEKGDSASSRIPPLWREGMICRSGVIPSVRMEQ
jgi:hypothetical protein